MDKFGTWCDSVELYMSLHVFHGLRRSGQTHKWSGIVIFRDNVNADGIPETSLFLTQITEFGINADHLRKSSVFTRKKRENYFKMRLNDRSRTTRPGAWPPYLLCRDFENRWDRFGAAGHRPIGLFARKFAFCKDRSVFKTENDNAWVIYKMRWAYAVHSRDDRIENVNQGCPSPLLLLQLQLVWKLSTGVTSLG